MSRNLIRLGLLCFIAVGLGWTFLARPTSGAISTQGVELIRASSCQAVRDRIVDLALEQLLQQRNSGYYGRHDNRGHVRGRPSPGRTADMDRRARSEEAPAAKSSAAGGAAGPSHHTSTNVQEVNVDEADLVKTDGKHIYTVHGQDLLILKSWPPSRTSIVARYRVSKKTTATPTQLFLKGNRLAVFSPIYSTSAAYSTGGYTAANLANGTGRRRVLHPARAFHGTRITVLDISDRTQPRVIRHLEAEGQMLQARLVRGDIYLVANNQLQLPATFWQAAGVQQQPPYGASEEDWRRWTAQVTPTLRRQLRQALGGVALASVLPRARTLDAQEQELGNEQLQSCSDIYLPRTGGQLGLLSVSHVDIARPSRLDSVGLMASGFQVYASTDNLYVGLSGAMWSRGGIADYNTTQLHKFALRGGQGGPAYLASGKVQGFLLNQFSMSEWQGHLRVATTDQDWAGGGGGWRGQPAQQQAGGGNNLFVVRQEGRTLRTVGAIRGLAKGERIFAVRMIEDKGYMVTFRQTDPLYTLDLRQPAEPRVVGELKIPGFSSYIHPLSKTHLLTIGQDADESGRVQGMHLQIFDVSDLKNPRRSHHHRFVQGNGSSSSSAQQDHHAFTYDRRTQTLAVPLTTYNYQDPSSAFNGLVVLRVGRVSGFTELGRVTHADLARNSALRGCQGANCDQLRKAAPQAYAHQAPISRSIVMDSYLYTLSGLGLKVSKLNDPQVEAAAVLFAPEPV